MHTADTSETDHRDTPAGEVPEVQQDLSEGDLCTWQTGGDHYHSPPEYCDEDAEPGEEYCTLHKEKAEALAKWETEVGLDDV